MAKGKLSWEQLAKLETLQGDSAHSFQDFTHCPAVPSLTSTSTTCSWLRSIGPRHCCIWRRCQLPLPGSKKAPTCGKEGTTGFQPHRWCASFEAPAAIFCKYPALGEGSWLELRSFLKFHFQGCSLEEKTCSDCCKIAHGEAGLPGVPGKWLTSG